MNIIDDLQAISVQEQTLVFSQFNEAHAWLLGGHLRKIALTRNLVLAIDIRILGRQLFFCALDGCTPDHANWLRRKGQVAAHFLRSSYAVGLQMQQQETTLAEKYGLSAIDYAPHGGAFPITVVGAGVIGTVTVSGLPQRADHELVVEALCAQLSQDYSTLALAQS